MPITAAGDVTIDGVTISKLFTKVPGNLSIKNATINGTNIKAKNMTIENSTILKDSQFGGPLRVEDTFIGITGLTLSVTKSELSNIGIDCGEENVNISFKDSEFTPKGSIVAGTGSTLTIDNSNVNAYGQNGGGITPIPEKNIRLENAEITAGSWSVESGKPLTIKHTGSAAPGTAGKLRTVKFNTGNAGSAVADQSVQNGKTVTKPADPTREGYTFSGWFTDRSYLQAYDFTAAVDEDFTLYAKWTKASTTPVHTHTFDAGKVTKEPTDTAEGECTYTCTGCGFTKKTVLPKLEAKPVSEPVVVEIGKEINNQDGDSFVVTGSEKSEDGNDVPVLSYNGSDDASGKVEIKGSVVLADGTKAKVTAIEDGALANNQKVTSVVIDPQIKTIGKNAFKDCKNIKSVTIGKNVGKIGENAFSGCKKIKKIYIKGKLTKKKVGKNAFKNVSKKVVVYYAKRLKSKEVKNLKTALKKAGIPNTVSYKSKKM